jgi:hypothetical protein
MALAMFKRFNSASISMRRRSSMLSICSAARRKGPLEGAQLSFIIDQDRSSNTTNLASLSTAYTPPASFTVRPRISTMPPAEPDFEQITATGALMAAYQPIVHLDSR